MTLRELVEKYLAASGGYGKAVPIASLGMSREEAERIFDVLDEDYHISRYFSFRNTPGEKSEAVYQINGFPQTHIAIDSEIQTVL